MGLMRGLAQHSEHELDRRKPSIRGLIDDLAQCRAKPWGVGMRREIAPNKILIRKLSSFLVMLRQRWCRVSAVLGKTTTSVRGDSIEPIERARFKPSRPLVHMHIPKTAGTTLTAALIETLRPRTTFGGFDRVLFGDYEDFASIDKEIRRWLYISADALPAVDFVSAHMAYSTLRRAFADAQFITVLREPHTRLLSQWLYWRGTSDEILANWGRWADRVRHARRPLASFLRERSVACHVDNLGVRMLLWPNPLIPVDDFIDPRHDHSLLAEARDRLAGFAFVEVLENAELSELLQTWLGQPCVLDRRNATPRIPEQLRSSLVDELTHEALDLVTMRSRLDLELWKEVARHSLSGHDLDQVRERTLLQSVARYATLMTGSLTCPYQPTPAHTSAIAGM